MRSWRIGGLTASLVAFVAFVACGSSSGSGGSSTLGTTVTTGTAATSGSGGSGGGVSGAMDPICLDPSADPSAACASCIDNLPTSQPCINTFAMQCRADPACLSYATCVDGCDNNNMSGAGGGSTACLAEMGNGGAGGAASSCIDCCYDGNNVGKNTYVTSLIDDCVCAVGAPCAAVCAM
jgi:hypothetical protein